MPANNKQSDALLAQLHKLHPKHIDLSLTRITRLLAALDNPQNKLPPVIHIAGTNGKGSTLAFLKAIFQANNERVDSYSSPHLINFHERINFDGTDIGEAELTALLSEIIEKNKGEPITFFESVTAAALLGFARNSADRVLLETGLGGRLDATNVIARPQLCIITPISMDHEHFLGADLASIAAEKAGILKTGIDAIIAPQNKVAQTIIEQHAKQTGGSLLIADKHWRAQKVKNQLRFHYKDSFIDFPLPTLVGAHQIENAGTAIMAAHHLGVAKQAIAQGLQQAHWRGRLELLPKGRLTKKTPATEIWLDGGHNPAAAQALADWAKAQSQKQPAPLYLVCGQLNSKQTIDWFARFKPLQPIIHTIAIPEQANSLSAKTLCQRAKEAGLAAKPFATIEAALRAIGDPQARILICGSLYLAGYVLREND